MSVNKDRPHLFVVPEDDACRQLANGFLLLPNVYLRQIQIEPVTRGWPHARQRLLDEHVARMITNPHRHVVLVIDFDGQGHHRREQILDAVPDEVRDRVYLLGSRYEPQDLKRAFNLGFEQIGLALAEECRTKQRKLWNDSLLSHNADDLDRIFSALGGFLFKD